MDGGFFVAIIFVTADVLVAVRFNGNQGARSVLVNMAARSYFGKIFCS